MPSQYVNLMPEDQDLGCQRRSRPEQPDQHRPDKAAGFLHRTERLRDSASVVSPIEFTKGTAGLDFRSRIFSTDRAEFWQGCFRCCSRARVASALKATISTIASLCPNELSRYVGCRRLRFSVRSTHGRKLVPPPRTK